MPAVLKRDVRSMDCYCGHMSNPEKFKGFRIFRLTSPAGQKLNGKYCCVRGFDDSGEKRLHVSICSGGTFPRLEWDPGLLDVKKIKIENLSPALPKKHFDYLTEECDNHVSMCGFICHLVDSPHFDGEWLMLSLGTPKWGHCRRDGVPFCEVCLANYKHKDGNNLANMSPHSILATMGEGGRDKPLLVAGPSDVDPQRCMAASLSIAAGMANCADPMAVMRTLCCWNDAHAPAVQLLQEVGRGNHAPQ